MAFLLQPPTVPEPSRRETDGNRRHWLRLELPASGAVLLRLLRTEASLTAGLSAWEPGDELGGAEDLALLIAFASASPGRHGAVHHAHLGLMDEAYRNAEPQPMPDLAVLRHGDYLAYFLEGTALTLFYDASTRPRIEPYRPNSQDETNDPARCVYCLQAIEPGTPVVYCPGPGCGLVYHQTEESGCWLALPECSSCRCPTALEEAPPWLPVGLGGVRSNYGL